MTEPSAFEFEMIEWKAKKNHRLLIGFSRTDKSRT